MRKLKPLLPANAAPTSAPDLAALPVRVDRRQGAELVTRYFFPVSNRSLEVWPLTWRHANGRALVETRELLEVAQRKLDGATPIRGGRRSAAEALTAQHAA